MVDGGVPITGVDTQGSRTALRDLFTVFVADDAATQTITRAVELSSKVFEDAAVSAWLSGDSPAPAVSLSGTLRGALAGALSTNGTPVSDGSGQAINELTVRLSTSLPLADTVSPTIAEYVQDSKLMDAATVERTLGVDALRTYHLSLRSYLIEKGFDRALLAFQDAFARASGEQVD